MAERRDRPPEGGLIAMRQAIDAIDDQILDLLERRILLSQGTVAAKQASTGSLHIRPEREAAILERLIRRARVLDAEVVQIIWRELMGQGRQAQSPLGLVLCAAKDHERFELHVRSHFGCTAPVTWVSDSATAFERARTEPVIAVVQEDPGTAVGELRRFDAVEDRAGNIVGYALGRVASETAAPGED